MKVVPNENTPQTQICFMVHIVEMESVVDAIFCEGSLPGNDNCHLWDLEGTFGSLRTSVELRKAEGPGALCYIKKGAVEMIQIKLGLAKAGVMFYTAVCFGDL